MARGLMALMNTSADRANRRRTFCLARALRSMATLRLLRFTPRNKAAIPACRAGPIHRVISPDSGSILMTSAPISRSNLRRAGPKDHLREINHLPAVQWSVHCNPFQKGRSQRPGTLPMVGAKLEAPSRETCAALRLGGRWHLGFSPPAVIAHEFHGHILLTRPCHVQDYSNAWTI